MFSLSVRSVESSSCGICSHDYSLWSRLKCPRLPLIEPRSRYFFVLSTRCLPSFIPPAALHVVQPKLFHHKPGAVLYVCLTLNRAAVQIVEHPLPDLWKHVLSSRRWKPSPLPLDPTCVGSQRSLPAASPARQHYRYPHTPSSASWLTEERHAVDFLTTVPCSCRLLILSDSVFWLSAVLAPYFCLFAWRRHNYPASSSLSVLTLTVWSPDS